VNDPDEYFEILEWPDDGEAGQVPDDDPVRPVSIVVQLSTEDGICQSFSIMSGDTLQIVLRGSIEGAEGFKITTVPVSITARLA
jgi:hypothetical protein